MGVKNRVECLPIVFLRDLVLWLCSQCSLVSLLSGEVGGLITRASLDDFATAWMLFASLQSYFIKISSFIASPQSLISRRLSQSIV